jgi:hypothetical protein
VRAAELYERLGKRELAALRALGAPA